METPIILHLDMDSYFASVEQQANPALVGKPVGVIKGEGRTCIIAASREAKKLGIKTGVSVYDARRLCPRIILVPSDFDKYFSVTQRFIKICSRYSPDLEVFSIDELFLEVTKTADFFGGISGLVGKIKENIKDEIGEYITCSIGISYNRLLAKLASDIRKPNGVFEITSTNRDEVLFSRRLTDVCGLGMRLEQRLFDAGITNFKALREVPEECLRASFGPFWSVELKKLSFGEDDSLLTRVWSPPAGGPKAKSVSRTFTLYKNTTDPNEIKATLRNLCEEAAYKARQMGMKGRKIGVVIRGEGGDYKHKTLKIFIDSGAGLFKIVWKLFEEMMGGEHLPAGRQVRFLGVWLGELKPKNEQTLSLFPEEKKEKNLITVMDKVNNRFGELALYPGVLLFSDKIIKSEVNGFLGDKAFRFNV